MYKLSAKIKKSSGHTWLKINLQSGFCGVWVFQRVAVLLTLGRVEEEVLGELSSATFELCCFVRLGNTYTPN